MRRRSSNWLQKGCRTVIPVLRLGIHPEMERPAILKRSMPSTAGVTIGIPPARVGNEADFQLQEEYTRRGAVSPGSAEKIPMFHADFPGFTLKIVEHSRNLLSVFDHDDLVIGNGNWAEGST